MPLTERQKEIKALQKQGKSASEIAKALGISVNAVYQQVRRMKARSGSGGSTARQASKAGRQSARKPSPAPAATAPQPTAAEQRDMTPLQAVRARRDGLTASLKEAEAAQAAAQRELDKATEQVGKVKARIDPELAQLDAAEAALKGEKPKAATPRKRPSRAAAAKPAQSAQSGDTAQAQGEAGSASESAPNAAQTTTNGTTPAEAEAAPATATPAEAATPAAA